MSQATPRHPITLQKVVYTMPGTDAVTVTRDVVYRTTEAGPLGMDIYYPARPEQTGLAPAVIFVVGFPGAGARARLGCPFKEMESYISWARLVAASGMIAVTYENREPAADLRAVFDYVRQRAPALGIDASRLAVWAASGNGPMGLTATMRESVTCAVLLYAYLLDVAQASAEWGFVDATAGSSLDDMPGGVPLFIVRAGRDQFAGVNQSIDQFVTGALARNLPISLTNHAEAPHAFDLSDDRPATHHVIRSVLAFLQSGLQVDRKA